jgi:hypothetical protein
MSSKASPESGNCSLSPPDIPVNPPITAHMCARRARPYCRIWAVQDASFLALFNMEQWA